MCLKFLSYHQFLASDINEDGVIDDTDKQILEDFVSGKINVLPGNHQWYLLDKNFTYTNPEDVLTQSLPLVVTLDSLSKKHGPVDFVAVKKGNISVDPGSLKENQVHTRAIPLQSIYVKAHPNPFHGAVTFTIETDNVQMAELKLYNLAGQVVLQQQYSLTKGQNNIQIDVDSQYEGLLMYQWIINDKTYNGKLTKIK